MKYRDMFTPPTQRERADDRQVENNAGGFVYEVDPVQRLRRFLVLGTEGGTFYASQRDLTRDNVAALVSMAQTQPTSYLAVLSTADRENIAPRHSTVLMALAVLYTNTDNTDVRGEIEARFGEFVRTGSHLFEFVDYAQMFRGWGRSLRRLIASWYKGMESDDLAYQVIKYRQRGGWSHRDLLRKAHVGVSTDKVSAAQAQVLDYVTHGTMHFTPEAEPLDEQVIVQYEAVKAETLEPTKANALTWEMLPTEALRDPAVWKSLIETRGRLPYTAMLRNLGRMTDIGVFDSRKVTKDVVTRLSDPEYVKRSRVHPFNVLTALKTYGSGQGFRGSLTWTPKQSIVDALDAAFYAALGNVEPTGKRICLALDVSGSMGMFKLMNSNVTAREGSAAMAMATLAADPDTTDTIAFTSAGWSSSQRQFGWGGGITEVGLSARRRMDDILRQIDSLNMGATDCALPMLWAGAQKKVYDAFVIYTDSETWSGQVQPMDALRAYREKFNPDARLVVVGMTSSGFSIADPEDAGSLDVVGFDSSAPSMISNFVSGKF